MVERNANPPKVLVVDDSPVCRSALASILVHDEFEVIQAADGPEGLRVALRERPDLILLDLNMPGWDGFETIRRLKDQYETQSIPVLFLSSIDSPTARANGLDLGAADFIAKSVAPEEMRARVRAALRVKAAHDVLERRAHLDALTGLGNRHAMEERLRSDWLQARRRGSPLAVLIADLDHFKLVNDRHGHQEGDRLLQATARTLRDAVRGGDFVARYGGDEFLVIAQDCGLIGAVAMGERFRIAMSSIPFSGPDGLRPGCVSVGVALDEPDDEGPEVIVGRADAALYRAKGTGRDSVWASERGSVRRALPLSRSSPLLSIAGSEAV